MAKRKPKSQSDEPEESNGDQTATAVADPPEESPRRGRKPKQKMIPGTEPEQIGEIEEAAEIYVAARDKRMLLTEREVETGKNVADLMKKHGLHTYKFDGQEIVRKHIEAKDKISVRTVKDGDDSGDEEK